MEKLLLDEHLRLRLSDLSPELFERFFLAFFNSGISLVIEREGARIERRIVEANTYAAGSGRSQDGIDLVARVEGDETWVFQCKRRNNWNVSLTKDAIKKAIFPAQHYFLLVACDPHEAVQKEMFRHPQWTFWNLDRICAELRLRVPKSRLREVLFFLSADELRRFAPFATDALVSPRQYMEAINRGGTSFHHRYPLVGREKELSKLEAFATDAKRKIFLLSARGGEGKSRLLWEFARTFEEKHREVEVAFLNPHSSKDIRDALWDAETPRVILVDDAHRVELVSRELLARVWESPATKLILAARPHGVEALEARLREFGFSESDSHPKELSDLPKKAVIELAKEALGKEMESSADELVKLVGASPFLTTLTGDLLRQGKLQWGSWSTDREFYATVLRSFETDNLQHLAPNDQKLGRRLLKIVAMLTPVTPDRVFFDRAAECLSASPDDVEDMLLRLQALGLLSAGKINLRVIPDLFSDFLVFDTAFDDSHRLSVLTSNILEKFGDQSASLLRNLSEAAWIANAEKIGQGDLLKPLLDAEFARFESLGFYERAKMLEEWAAFSVYLPGQSLELARKAMREDAAPSDRLESWQAHFGGLNSHQHTKSRIPIMLKPVALWRDDYRHEALDILWKLGIETPKSFYSERGSHPWDVIAEISKIEPRKPRRVSESVLEWIGKVVRRPETKPLLESSGAILSTLLAPIFARQVEFTERQGRKISFWTQSLRVDSTKKLRDGALDILLWVVENCSWIAAVQVVGAVSHALERVGLLDVSQAGDLERLREEWRPERLKALEVLSSILDRHPEVAARFAVRQWTTLDLAYEEDPVFAEASRKVFLKIREDLPLRLMIAMINDGHYEFSEQTGFSGDGEDHEKSEKLWNDWLRQIAWELMQAYPRPEDAANCLEALISECVTAGYSPRFFYLFPTIGMTDQGYAEELARLFLDREYSGQVSHSWFQLLFGMQSRSEIQRLLRKASESSISEIRTGIVGYFCFRNKPGIAFDLEEREMIASLARTGGELEIAKILQFIKLMNEANATWGFQLLEWMPLKPVAEQLSAQFFEALFPYRAPGAKPPVSTVNHVLEALVAVPEIETRRSNRPYTILVKDYPRSVYDFVVRRLNYAATLPEGSEYQAIPQSFRYQFRLDALSKEKDYEEICDFLWNAVFEHWDSPVLSGWLQLFQGVVLTNEGFWMPRLLEKIRTVQLFDDLRLLVAFIEFDGSLEVFRHPQIAAAFLQRAEEMEGAEGLKRIRWALYSASGPQGKSFSSGVLDPGYDYLEAEAFKAAEKHAEDALLGPFYRWIGETERHERELSLKSYEADMASLD